jgi:hypothetical protein
MTLARTDLMLTMPKFTFETELSLRPTLAAVCDLFHLL